MKRFWGHKPTTIKKRTLSDWPDRSIEARIGAHLRRRDKRESPRAIISANSMRPTQRVRPKIKKKRAIIFVLIMGNDLINMRRLFVFRVHHPQNGADVISYWPIGLISSLFNHQIQLVRDLHLNHHFFCIVHQFVGSLVSAHYSWHISQCGYCQK